MKHEFENSLFDFYFHSTKQFKSCQNMSQKNKNYENPGFKNQSSDRHGILSTERLKVVQRTLENKTVSTGY